MNRRDFIKFLSIAGSVGSLGALVSNSFASQAYNEEAIYAGWIDNPKIRDQFIKENKAPFLNQINQEIKGTGKGKVALLWKYLEAVTKDTFKAHRQTVGDCVGHAYGVGVDFLTAIQIEVKKATQRWVAEAAIEIIYGGARIEVGKNKYKKRWYGDGVNGLCAAEFVKSYGILLRQKYLNDKYDFRQYSGNLSRDYGNSGVPDDLEPLCKLHPIGWAALVTSWEEARDCIYNGYPVIVCSNQGFYTKSNRDKDGFLVPSRNPWWHSMILAGIDDAHKRPGGLLINSWGDNWLSGPKRHDQPESSFWVDAAVLDRMCKRGDTVAISSYVGYPRQDYLLW